MDRRAMIGHLAAKFDVKLNENDPALLMVEMCRFMMESVLDSTGQKWEGRMVDVNEKLTLAIGAMAGAIEEMNAAADNLVQKKLIDLNNHVNQMVGLTIKNQIETSLGGAVEEEIKKVRIATAEIAKNVAAMKERSVLAQVGTVVGSSVLGALLAFGVMWYAISTGMIHVRDTSGPAVAQAAPIQPVQQNR